MNIKIQALRARYSAMRIEALATLDVYFNNASGIGEHPQIIDEIDKLVRAIADADSYLEVLNNTFTAKVEDPGNESVNS